MLTRDDLDDDAKLLISSKARSHCSREALARSGSIDSTKGVLGSLLFLELESAWTVVENETTSSSKRTDHMVMKSSQNRRKSKEDSSPNATHSVDDDAFRSFSGRPRMALFLSTIRLFVAQ